MPDWNPLLFGPAPAAGPYTPQPVSTGWETGLDPTLVAKAQQLKTLAAQEGIDLAITAGHRSREDQARLYAQGRTTPGGIITYAKPGTSRHESGRAIDVVPLKDGKPDWKSPHWRRLGELGQQLGLEWGGTWKRLNDRPHFQLPATTAPLQATRTSAPRDWGQALFPAPAFAAAATPASGAIPGVETLTPAFRTKVDQVARRLRMDPQHLLTVMSFETAGTFDPAVRNEAGSGATGLIQFMPKTARQLGTTTDDLARMTPEQQLDYVERYLRPYAGRMRTQQDAYMAVLSPSAIGKPASQVLFAQGTRAYELNKALDPAQTGRVTIGDTMRSVGRHLQASGTPARAAAATDWGAALFDTAAPGASGLQATGHAQPDWGQTLFGTPAPAVAVAPVSPVRPLASQAPAPGHAQGPALDHDPGARDWGQELFA